MHKRIPRRVCVQAHMHTQTAEHTHYLLLQVKFELTLGESAEWHALPEWQHVLREYSFRCLLPAYAAQRATIPQVCVCVCVCVYVCVHLCEHLFEHAFLSMRACLCMCVGMCEHRFASATVHHCKVVSASAYCLL